MKTKDIILIPIFTALIAVGAFIKIPTPIVPFTLQIVFTTLAGLLLGSKRGALSVALYVGIGLIGVPVFTQGGGLSYVFQPTFGYLVSFIIGAYVAGLIVERSSEKNLKTFLIASFVNLVIVYVIGFAYGYSIINFYLNAGKSFSKLVVPFVLLPLPGDILSLSITSIIAKRLHGIV